MDRLKLFCWTISTACHGYTDAVRLRSSSKVPPKPYSQNGLCISTFSEKQAWCSVSQFSHNFKHHVRVYNWNSLCFSAFSEKQVWCSITKFFHKFRHLVHVYNWNSSCLSAFSEKQAWCSVTQFYPQFQASCPRIQQKPTKKDFRSEGLTVQFNLSMHSWN